MQSSPNERPSLFHYVCDEISNRQICQTGQYDCRAVRIRVGPPFSSLAELVRRNVFLGASFGKLTQAQAQVATAERLHIPWDHYRLIGIPELAASVGLVVGMAIAPLGVAAAIGLALLMSGAAAIRLRVGDAAAYVVGDSVFLAAAVVTAILRITTA